MTTSLLRAFRLQELRRTEREIVKLAVFIIGSVQKRHSFINSNRLKMSAVPSKKPKTYHLSISMRSGRNTFFFHMSFSKCICLICQSIAISNKGNVERHFRTLHKNDKNDGILVSWHQQTSHVLNTQRHLVASLGTPAGT